ncbi:hypothetical protein PSCLAVI8L_270003 [Pseudoclavibacter sp. 8L]|nr:hypothetical protein PSCLAVI8L_270003 [Pseudoclavibacter sp. 8L]
MWFFLSAFVFPEFVTPDRAGPDRTGPRGCGRGRGARRELGRDARTPRREMVPARRPQFSSAGLLAPPSAPRS